MDDNWMHHAACKGADPDWFHPTKETAHYYQNAFALCDQCIVRTPCLEYAMSFLPQNDLHGIYGGTTARERRAMRKGKPVKRLRHTPQHIRWNPDTQKYEQQ